jgi:hypothetical protein
MELKFARRTFSIFQLPFSNEFPVTNFLFTNSITHWKLGIGDWKLELVLSASAEAKIIYQVQFIREEYSRLS